MLLCIYYVQNIFFYINSAYLIQYLYDLFIYYI